MLTSTTGRQMAVAAAAAVVLAASLAVVAARSSSDDEVAASGAVVNTTTTSPPAETATTAVGGDAPPPAPPPGDAAGGTPTPAPVPGAPAAPAPRLRVVSGRIDFGDNLTARPLAFANDGGAPLTWGTSTSSPVVSVVPASGTLAPGATTQVSVRLDRLSGPEGRLTGSVRVSSNGGEGTVEVTATVIRPPAVLQVTWSTGRLAQAPCSVYPTAASITAAATDESGISGVVLHWRDPSGQAGSRALAAGGDGVFRGELGPFTFLGSVTWWVQATDRLGAVTRAPDETAEVAPCE